MSVEKVSLTSLRCLLFFYFGGAGCLLPFLSLHAEATGLGITNSRIVSIVAPLFATLGPVLIGPLVDRLAASKKSTKSDTAKHERATLIRTFLSLSILMSAVFYSLLLSVPSVERLTPRQPSVSFVCNENGASIVQEKCNDNGCYQFPDRKAGLIRLKSCRFNCDYPSHYGYIEGPLVDVTTARTTTTTTTTTTPSRMRSEADFDPDDFFGTERYEEDDYSDFGSGEEAEFNWNPRPKKRTIRDDSGLSLEEPPHICYDNLLQSQKKDDRSLRMCFVYTATGGVFKVNVTIKPVHEDDQHCSFPLGENFSCRIPDNMEKPDESCKAVCDIEDPYVPGSVLLQSQCRDVNGDVDLTFWLYLTFRAFGDLFFVVSVCLIIGGTLVAARDKIGREFIPPSVAYCLFSTLVSYLHSNSLSPLKLDNIPSFFLGVVGFGLLSMFALFVLIFSGDLPLGPPDWWWTNRTGKVDHKREFAAVLFVLALLGALWGPLYFHVPWHISERKDVELFVGAAAAAAALLSIPFAWKASTIINYCGYSNVFIAAFTFYILRYTGSFFLDRAWMVVCNSCFEVFTLCLVVFTGVLYIRHLVPRHVTFRTQSLGIAAHFCVGNALGCLISTLLSPSETDIEIASQHPRNATFATSILDRLDDEVDLSGSAYESMYHLLYCVGAVSAAVIAVVYFFVYHCCLKKKCLAPSHNKNKNNSLVQDNAGNGMYTPLRVLRNGRQTHGEADG